MKYRIGEKLEVDRSGPDKLEFKMGDEKTQVFTEDLAALVKEELPNDRAMEFLSDVEEKFIQSGKARVMVRANRDIKRGENVVFTLDINKYVGDTGGVRITPSGVLF